MSMIEGAAGDVFGLCGRGDVSGAWWESGREDVRVGDERGLAVVAAKSVLRGGTASGGQKTAVGAHLGNDGTAGHNGCAAGLAGEHGAVVGGVGVSARHRGGREEGQISEADGAWGVYMR